MFNRMTSPDTGNATSSPASAAGPSQPDLLGGPTIENSGPAPRRASRSPSRVKEKPRLTIGTSGPTFSGSPVPDGPLSSWESRLRRRLARTGSTECSLIWKESDTPAGRPLSRLVPSTRPTDGTDFGLWRTPNTVDAKGGTRLDVNAGQVQLCHQVKALWTTPVADDTGIRLKPYAQGGKALSMMVSTAFWPTPTASLADKGVRSMEGAFREASRSHGPDLAAVAAAALWQTPVADDSVNRAAGKFNSRGEPKLSAEVRLTQWPTPTATDANRGMTPPRPQDTGVPLNQAVALQAGVGPDGSQVTTGKPAGSLNPEFVCWLMGFWEEWLLCAPGSKAEPRNRARSTGIAVPARSKRSAMPSSRKSRPK